MTATIFLWSVGGGILGWSLRSFADLLWARLRRPRKGRA
jgi:hypothetical protein